MPNINWAPITEFVGRNWLFTLQFAIIGWLAQKIFSLYGENATIKAQHTSFQERNSDLKMKIDVLEKENAQLRKTIQEKCTDEALFAKYDFNQGGVPIQKASKKPYCPACLQTSKREVPLADDSADNYWRCTVNRDHCFEKPGSLHRRGTSFVEGLDENPY